MAAVEEWLPEELMTLILSKLPVKSLLRFKCVQKSWYSLINSPQFIHLHRRSSSSSSSPQFVFNRLVKEERGHIPSSYETLDDDDLGGNDIVVPNIYNPRHVLSFYSNETLDDLSNDMDIPVSNWWGTVSISGSCDGLVCIHNHYEDEYGNVDTDQILICNPAIREWRSLFVPPVSSGYRIKSVAFGSDPSTAGQYKVVMIGLPRDCGEREAKVYDFGTDSWRETGAVIPAPFPYSHHTVSFNGAFHWCTGSLDILTFHISDEVTGSIPMPEFARASMGKELYVSSKSQLLSLVVFDWEGMYEICVMNEYGVKESWTRLFKIGPLPYIFEPPLAFWDEQQQLLLQTHTQESQLVSCHLQNQNLRYFPIYGHCGSSLVSNSESLVSVNGIF